jgi:hypothetical protein
MMEDLYPDQEWHEWLWPQPRANFWASLKNQKRYLDWVMKERGMKDLADWYSVADLAFDGQRGSPLHNRPSFVLRYILTLFCPIKDDDLY